MLLYCYVCICIFLPRLTIEVPSTAFPIKTLTLASDLDLWSHWAMVMTRTHAKGQGQRSLGSKGMEAIALPPVLMRSVIITRWCKNTTSLLLIEANDGWQSEVTCGGHFGPVQDIVWGFSGGEFLLSVSSDQTARLHAVWASCGDQSEVYIGTVDSLTHLSAVHWWRIIFLFIISKSK